MRIRPFETADGVRKSSLCTGERIRPHRDDKILTSWNGLMIAALRWRKGLHSDEYIKAAEAAYGFIQRNLVRGDGRLLARYRDGESAFPAYLDDYAFLVWGY